MYVSTCYANCHLMHVEERVYPLKADGDHLLQCLEWMNADQLEKQCFDNLFEGRPNTYTATKALTEKYLAQNCGNVSIAIARPSIVIGAKSEPEVGYCDSGSAANYAFIAQGK